jgi:large subunit ribosomal protein L21
MNNEWAVINQKGRQYLVAEGSEIEIEKIDGDKGEKVKFSEVLLWTDGDKIKIGQPLVDGLSVLAEIKDQLKAKKVVVAKFKAKSRYRRLRGHRQLITLVKINKIVSEQTKKSSTKLAAD